MKQKKTIRVSELLERANAFLLNSADYQTGEREGVSMFIETVLLETGNYAGFGYLNPEQMKESEFGTSFGIEPSLDQWFDGTDYTRVSYYRKG